MHLNKILVIREKKRALSNDFPVLIANRGRRKLKALVGQTIKTLNYILFFKVGPALCIMSKTRHQKLVLGVENNIQTLTKIVRDATPPGVTFK